MMCITVVVHSTKGVGSAHYSTYTPQTSLTTAHTTTHRLALVKYVLQGWGRIRKRCTQIEDQSLLLELHVQNIWVRDQEKQDTDQG